MKLMDLWDKVPTSVKGIIFTALGAGGTFGTGKFIERPEVVLPISAGRQQLIEAGHVDADKLRERLNRAVAEEFKSAGFCNDPVVAEKEVAKTAKMARCESPAATPNN